MPVSPRPVRWLQPAATLTLATFVLLGACRRAHSAGDAPPILPSDSQVDPAFREDWAAVEAARASDPTGDGVDTAADALLAQDPPETLRQAAVLAKAERAHGLGEDGAVVRLIDQVLPEGPAKAGQIVDRLRVLRLRALTRGGDPRRALDALSELEPGLELVDAAAMRAVALDRAGDAPGALIGFAAWRARLRADDADALYAEARIRALLGRVDTAALAREVRQQTDAVAACLVTRLEGRAPRGAADWIEGACRPGPHTVGVLLPRTGRFAALGDRYLAAVSATLRARSRAGRPPVEIRWVPAEDATQAAVAARTLVEAGADALVGPPGGPAIAAAVAGAPGVQVIVPGEGQGGAAGAGPSLEARIAALVHRAKTLGTSAPVVLVPDNGYGKRAGSAASKFLSKNGFKVSKILMYSPSETSFSSVLGQASGRLGRGASVLILDHVRRVELVVRQLRRAWPDRNTPVFTTAEGVSLEPGARILEGAWVAPAAPVGPDTGAFVGAYRELEGTAPDAQALLVWAALGRALGDRPAAGATASLARIEGGVLVAQESQ